MDSSSNKRLHELLSRLCDGEIDAQESAELSNLLDNNQEGLQEYVDYTSLHLQLGHRLRADDLTEESQAEILASLSQDKSRPILSKSIPGRGFQVPNLFTISALAASLLIAAFFIIRSYQTGPSFTARVVQKIACQWGDEHWDSTQSPHLESGQEIVLDEGLMLIEFGNGAEVLLEAPVEFTVIAKDRGDLRVGKLTAVVPKRARGFSVEIPSAEVVDLGTNFGLLVDEEGNSETHVFAGKVELRTGSDGDSVEGRAWSLSADEAVALSVANEVSRFPAQTTSFVHASSDMNRVSDADRPQLKVPENSDLVLWLDAGNSIQLDGESRVVSWGELSQGEKRRRLHAWQDEEQSRPLWVSAADEGRPAVRFDGSEFLMTTPFELGDSLTAFCVLKGTSTGFPKSTATEILSLTGSPSLVLQQIDDDQLAGAIRSKKLHGEQALSGRLLGTLPEDDEVIVAAYLYDKAKERASLYINGVLVGRSSVTEGVANRSSLILGCSNKNGLSFTGDVYEVLLFDAALSSDQSNRVSSDLMAKYGVPPSDPEPRVLSGLVPEEDE